MVRDSSPLTCRAPRRRRLLRTGSFVALGLAATTVFGGCDPSELKARIEGNTDIPSAWTELVPGRAEEGLIDAKIEADFDGGGLSLKYHDGEWSDVVDAFRTHLGAAGYVELGTCSMSDTEAKPDEVASAILVKPTDGGADVIMPGLGILIKSSGHFFVKVQRHELRTLHKPKNCTFTDAFDTFCESTSTEMCTFKSKPES